jgi:predicted PurR-regulated permease PerM
MELPRRDEDLTLWILIAVILVISAIAFWPLMTVFVWTVALAVALMPFHQRLSMIVKPSVSAMFITLWVFLLILAVISAAANVVFANIQYIGVMATTLVKGLAHTGFESVLPPMSAGQLNDIPGTIVQLVLNAVTSTTSNPLLLILQIIIFFLLLSMFLYYGEEIWGAATRTLSKTETAGIGRLTEIASNTIYSLIVIQISAALICFVLAIPFFYFLGYGHELLFATMIGLAMLIPLIGAQAFLLVFMLYMVSLGDYKSAALVVLIGYPLLSGWIDFYYRPVMMGRRVAVHPVFMMIGIFAGVPFMGIVGFILGPVLVALAVTGLKIYAERLGMVPAVDNGS